MTTSSTPTTPSMASINDQSKCRSLGFIWRSTQAISLGEKAGQPGGRVARMVPTGIFFGFIVFAGVLVSYAQSPSPVAIDHSRLRLLLGGVDDHSAVVSSSCLEAGSYFSLLAVRRMDDEWIAVEGDLHNGWVRDDCTIQIGKPRFIWATGRTPIDVVIHLGQSNQVGGGSDGSFLTSSNYDDSIIYWEYSGTWDFDNRVSEWGPPPEDWSTLDSWQGFGPSIGLLRVLYQEGGYLERGGSLAGFKFAWNGTAMSKRWLSGVSGSLFHELELFWEVARKQLEDRGYVVRIVAIDWTGNEGDSNFFGFPDNTAEARLTQALFEQQIEGFVEDLRSLKGASDRSMILWNRVHNGDPAVFAPERPQQLVGWPIVRESQVNSIGRIHNSIIVNTDDAERPFDDIHYSSRGKERIGVEKARAFLGMSYDEAK